MFWSTWLGTVAIYDFLQTLQESRYPEVGDGQPERVTIGHVKYTRTNIEGLMFVLKYLMTKVIEATTAMLVGEEDPARDLEMVTLLVEHLTAFMI